MRILFRFLKFPLSSTLTENHISELVILNAHAVIDICNT